MSNLQTGKRWPDGCRPSVGRRRHRRFLRWCRLLVRRGTCARLTRSSWPTGCRGRRTIWAIAAELGRSPSTVSREIRRNRPPAGGQPQGTNLSPVRLVAQALRPRRPGRTTSRRPHGAAVTKDDTDAERAFRCPVTERAADDGDWPPEGLVFISATKRESARISGQAAPGQRVVVPDAGASEAPEQSVRRGVTVTLVGLGP
ncbi:helix-turn-helix domain-containing protein [Streptomyces vinaceus]|uniref:helix-turn-helix domain-containing protein n=1 Tax=Streptomyces vinaceus TaxID=1960 RepID=UPI0035DA9BF8